LVQWEAFTRFIRKDWVNIDVISFQELVNMISEIDSSTIWRELQTWVSNKIDKTDPKEISKA
jgi:hypothetical protein